jgi:hypothetical protein
MGQSRACAGWCSEICADQRISIRIQIKKPIFGKKNRLGLELSFRDL